MKKIIFTIILFYLLIGKNNHSICQGYYRRVPQGIEASNISTVYSMLLRNDTLFVGHEDGLAIYNGIYFENIPFQDGSTKACDNLTLNEDGRIWGRTFEGDVFYYKNNQLIKHPISNQKTKILPSITQSKNATYVQYNDKFYKIEDTNLIELFSKEIGMEPIVESITDSTEMLFLEKDGCIRINLNKKRDNTFSVNFSPLIIWDFFNAESFTSFKNNYGYILFDFNDKKLYFDNNYFTFHPSYLFSEKEQLNIQEIQKLLKYPKNAKINEIKYVHDRFFTITGQKGINIIDLKKHTSHYFLQDEITTRVEISERGEMWIGTKKNGIIYIPSLEIEATQFKTNLRTFKSHTLSDSLFAIGGINGNVEVYSTSNRLKYKFKSKMDAEVHSVYAQDDKIYFSSTLFSAYDTKTEKLSHGGYLIAIKDMYFSEEANLAATSRNLVYLDKYQQDGRYKHVLSRNWFTDIEPYESKKILIATKHGLFELDKISKKLNEVRTQFENELLSIRQVKFCDGKIYVLIEGKGVYFVDKKNQKAIKISDDLNIKKVTKYKNKMYALASSGVFELSEKRAPKLIFDIVGFLSNEKIQDLEILNETIYLMLNDRFLSIPIENSICDYQVDLKKFNLNRFGTFQWENGKYVSQYDDNRLVFYFKVLPSFNHFNSTRVSYRIDGSIKEWTPLEIKKGLYVLDVNWIPWKTEKITIQLKRGNNIQYFDYSLQIEKPFWFQTWFIVLCVLSLLFLSYLFYRIRINQLKKKSSLLLKEQALKNQVLSAELTAIRSQMQPHFIYNTLTSIQSKILSGDKKSAFDSANSFSRLIRNVLDNSGKEFISLKDEITFLKSYIKLESDRIDGGVELDYHCDESINQMQTIVPTLICQPIIENAFLHGLRHSKGNKKLSLHITQSKNTITISIQDNGIGRNKSQEINSERRKTHQSFASIALQERIKRINSSISTLQVDYRIEDLHQGTKVTLNIIYVR